MQYKKLSCYALFLIAITIYACGGGEEKPAAPSPGAPAPSAAAPSGNAFDPSKATATVTGKVTFDGGKPVLAKLPLTPECKQVHPGEAMEQSVELNADNTLQHVLVYVKSGADKWTYTTPTDPIVLDQVGCQYKPHVVSLMANQPLKIRNSDPFLHNIHPLPKNNPQFNLGQPVKGMETEKSFATPEVAIPVKCDVHRWMSSYIAVLSHPFHNITAAAGTYTIKLPAGTFTLEAWHEKFGTQTQDVTVADGQSQEVNFTFKAS
ncbi:carboxypeptidase regulatory-like domain-containing protein [bacterium]|nr:carboxypeptidase regulatory-like domain-containing protein [bacterium]MCI0605183.1 carboxypeptidase regulatory-like domain-containing protein [bacterium]